MLVNRNDERAWESYYTLQANKTKQGDATYEENDEFSTLTLEDQLIVRNQMHAAHRNWTWFHFITQISNEVLQTTSTRRMGLSDSTLNMLLSLAQHAASMISKTKKEEDSREVQGTFLESLRFPPAAASPPTTSPKTLRKRLEEEFAIKQQFDYEKQVFARKCDAVPIYDRSREPTVLADFLHKLTVALKGWYAGGSEADKVEFIRARCSPDTTIWLDSLSPIPTTAQAVVDSIQAEHQVDDDERSARDKLFALKLKAPYLMTSFDTHAASFDKLLPLVPTIDRVSLRYAFLSTLPPELKTKVEELAVAKSLTESTYAQIKALGRELWTQGFRPSTVQAHPLGIQQNAAQPLSQQEFNGRPSIVCFYCHRPGHIATDCRKRMRDFGLDEQSHSSTTQQLKDLQVEFKALALKLEKKETESPKQKSTKSKSKTQLKKARVKALPEDDLSRFATFPNLLALASSELDMKVANLNKSLPANHSLRLLPSHVRMDLPSAEPEQLSQEKHTLNSLLKMERELHKGDSRCFLDRRAEYLVAASEAQQYRSPKNALEVANMALNSATLEPGSAVPLSSAPSCRLEMHALIGASPVKVLLDTGAQAMFMGFRMAERLGLRSKPVERVQQVAFGKENSVDMLTEYVTAQVQLGSYWKDLNFYLADIGDLAIFGVPWFLTLRLSLDWSSGSIRFIDRLTGLSHDISNSRLGQQPQPLSGQQVLKSSAAHIYRISVQELRNVKKSCKWLKVIHLKDIVLEKGTTAKRPADPVATDPILSRWTNQFPSLFGKMTGLPVNRPENMAIETDPAASTPRSRPLAHLSEIELKSLKATLTDLLERGFIRTSTSSFGAAILFAKKADGSLRLCIDYRGLNGITKKMQGPLPIISEMRNRLAGATFFSKLDLKEATLYTTIPHTKSGGNFTSN